MIVSKGIIIVIIFGIATVDSVHRSITVSGIAIIIIVVVARIIWKYPWNIWIRYAFAQSDILSVRATIAITVVGAIIPRVIGWNSIAINCGG